MRVLSLSTLVLLLTITAAKTVRACDCVTPSQKECFQNADVVFEGEVLRIVPVGESTAYTFKIDRVLKGAAVSELTLLQGGTNCHYHFWPDIVYRVYARKFQEQFTTGVCSGNEVLKTKERRLSQTGWHDTSLWKLWYVKVAVILGAACLLCLFIWFLPGKRRHTTA